MDFGRRQLVEEPSFCSIICPKDGSSNCTTSCLYLCPSHRCLSPDPIVPPSPPVPSSHNRHKSSTLLIVVMVTLGASFLFICCYGFYVRYVNTLRRTNSASQSDHQTHDRDDQEHGPRVDRRIINSHTVGHQLSMINSITEFKYKKGDGLVQVSDCSVCLNEFQEGESLRLLPNCSHAFHIPCIDSWLKSRTNCPMCRAPIVTNSETKTSLPEPRSVSPTSEGDGQNGT